MVLRLNDHFMNLFGHLPEIDRRNCVFGYVAGLAEKVYIKACHAAMLAPLREDAQWVREVVELVAGEYGLVTCHIGRLQRIEFWLFKYEDDRAALLGRQNDNQFRALLCGMVTADIDHDHVIEAPVSAVEKTQA